MSNQYVGVASVANIAAVTKLVNDCIGSNGYLFLRWPHKVHCSSVSELPEEGLNCPEGQAFNQDKELRWKRKGSAYELLLLSESEEEKSPVIAQFSAIGSSWETKALDAKSYPATETRFPKKITIPEGLDLGQRYFIDAETACVQFIALRAKQHGS